MREFKIIVDSSCDLSIELRKRFHIEEEYCQGTINCPDGKSYKADLDYHEFSPKDFLTLVRANGGKMKSSLPSLGGMVDLFTKYAKNDSDLLVITLSSRMSGGYNAAVVASNMVKEKYPEIEIYVIDSLKYSAAIGMLAILASQLREEGKSLKETYDIIQKQKMCLHEFGPMDDLFYLYKSGRIDFGKAFFGNLAGVIPMADFTRDGKNVPLGKLRGTKKISNTVINYMKEIAIDLQNQIIFIAHTDRESRAKTLKELVETSFKPKEVIIVDVGMTCATNIGPGLCSVFFFGKELTEDRHTELEAFYRAINV